MRVRVRFRVRDRVTLTVRVRGRPTARVRVSGGGLQARAPARLGQRLELLADLGYGNGGCIGGAY